MVRAPGMAEWALLRALWKHRDATRPERYTDALLVHGLPVLLQRQNGHHTGTIACPAAKVGLCDVSRNH